MAKSVVPMIHVPDVRATVEWYQSIGFNADATYGNETADGFSFAVMSFGTGTVFFSQDGETSTKRRREVDLYVNVDDVDELYAQLKDRVEVVEGLHDTFYGMREIIIKDINGFWITFAQESVFNVLMGGVSEGNPERVRQAVASGKLELDTLKTALAAAIFKKHEEIVELLKQAGATPPPEISLETLESYVGTYQGKHGPPVEISIKEGRLFAAPGAQQPLSLWPLDQVTFKPIAIDDATIIFKPDGLTFIQDGCENEFHR